MTLIRWTPVARKTPTAFIADDFTKLIDEFFAGSRLATRAAPVATTTAAIGRIEFTEGDASYGFRLETPGFPKESIRVEVEGDVLTLSGRVEVKEEGADEVTATSTRAREFTRRVRLPGRVANEGHTATVRDGVLTVALAKLAPRTKEPLKIAVG